MISEAVFFIYVRQITINLYTVVVGYSSKSVFERFAQILIKNHSSDTVIKSKPGNKLRTSTRIIRKHYKTTAEFYFPVHPENLLHLHIPVLRTTHLIIFLRRDCTSMIRSLRHGLYTHNCFPWSACELQNISIQY